MAIRRIPREAIAQPQGYAEVDWSNPITTGLVVVFNATSSVDPATGAPITTSGSLVATPVGVAISATGTAKAFSVADSPAQRSARVTNFALLRRTASLASNYDAIGKNFESNGPSSYVTDTISYNGNALGDNVMRANQGVTGALVSSGDYTHPDTTKWHTAGGTYGDGFVRLYVDGVNRASAASGAIAYGATGDNSFAHNFGGKTGGFEIALALRWNRVLSAAEMASISANPWQIFRDDLIVPVVAAAGGTTVSPAKGSLVFGGKVPTVARTANQTVAPTVGHLAFMGYAPTITRNANQSVSPAKGALTFTGYAPAIGQTITVTVAPGTGHLIFTGYVPTVARTANQAVAPGAGHLVFAGYAPTVYQSAAGSVQPATGHLTFTGFVPTIARTDNRTVAPSTGHLNFGGHVPTVAPNGTPGTTLDTIYKILTNRQVLDAATGKFTVYDDDDITVLFQANAWADAAGTVPYSGGALRRIDRLA